MFKAVLKLYETKQHKKGLKTCESILKKVPNHGETLSMKGLLLSCTPGRKKEAEEFVKRGLRFDITSHVCWHVYGLLYRSQGDYPQAIKCYLNALRHDADNLQILRDLSLLQVQMRDLKGYQETRRRLLMLKPSNRNNWIGFSMAYHLSNNYDLAVKILASYAGTLEAGSKAKRPAVSTASPTSPSTPLRSYEDSEMFLYQAALLEESGEFEQALAFLENAERDGSVRDLLALRERRGGLLLLLGRFNAAREQFQLLVKYNADNYAYHRGLQNSVLGVEVTDWCGSGCGLPVHGDCGRLLVRPAVPFFSSFCFFFLFVHECALVTSPHSFHTYFSFMQTAPLRRELSFEYQVLNMNCPRARAVERISLDFFGPGEHFRACADAFLRRQICRGTPASFGQLKYVVEVYHLTQRRSVACAR